MIRIDIDKVIKAFNFDKFDNSHNSFLWPEYLYVKDGFHQDCNAEKVNCSYVHIETSSLYGEFVNKNRCSMCSFNIRGGNFDNSYFPIPFLSAKLKISSNLQNKWL